jgi:hypothetical protein
MIIGITNHQSSVNLSTVVTRRAKLSRTSAIGMTTPADTKKTYRSPNHAHKKCLFRLLAAMPDDHNSCTPQTN